MNYKQIILKRGKEDSLLRFHPWIFSGAIAHIDQPIDEGEVVRVLTSDKRFIAVGHYQIGSIAVRVLSFNDITIDTAFWKRRLEAALSVRQTLGVVPEAVADASTAGQTAVSQTRNTIYRLVHGEGDNLPGLVVDCYGRTAVMQAHSVGMHLCRKQVADALAEVMQERIDNIFYKSETTLPFKAELGQENEFLLGGTTENVALENGLRFRVDWLKGQKTGFFVDQRDNRSKNAEYNQNSEY